MGETQKNVKKSIPKKAIFRVMLCITYIVSGIFLLKNVFGGNVAGIAVIGGVLLVFTMILVVMRAIKMSEEKQQMFVSVGLIFVIFSISLFSGDFYSDDFLLYLSAIAMSGMYLRPKYTVIQVIFADILLFLQYIIHPEKAESLGQFIMCSALFTLAAGLFYLSIKRGRSFIQISENRAEEAEHFLDSLKRMGEDLERSVESSSEGIEGLRDASQQLNSNADDLKQGSTSIAQGAKMVADTCEDVHQKIQQTEKQVDELTNGVHNFENSLSINRKNMDEMSHQMEQVQTAMRQANEVFCLLQKQMKEISEVTEQLNSISSSTTMLALNASIEAARAGQSGAGFAVVAGKVQQLAVDSNECSSHVASVVNQMQKQIQETTQQMAESGHAIKESLNALQGLENGFDKLTEQFASLYQNIEAQNHNINQVDNIFDKLKGQVAEMSHYSDDNQSAVESIAEAMVVYQESMNQMIADTDHVHELSASMMNFSRE